MPKIVLSPNVKPYIDAALSLAGLAISSLSAHAASLAYPYDVAVPIAGTIGGYLLSDMTTIVDGGVMPTQTQIVSQAQAVYPQVRPLLLSEIAKLSPTDAAVANAALSMLESKLGV